MDRPTRPEFGLTQDEFLKQSFQYMNDLEAYCDQLEKDLMKIDEVADQALMLSDLYVSDEDSNAIKLPPEFNKPEGPPNEEVKESNWNTNWMKTWKAWYRRWMT